MKERGGAGPLTWMPLADLSPRLPQAVLMGEDAGFYIHSGFDTHEMKEAFKRNWEEGRTVRGASTISQQLAKNLFLSTERSYTRKLKEAVLTYRLEKALSKERIFRGLLERHRVGRRYLRRRGRFPRCVREVREPAERRRSGNPRRDDPESLCGSTPARARSR